MPDPAPSPSLTAQIGRIIGSRLGMLRLQRWRPQTYLPALAVLAAIPPLAALTVETQAVLLDARNRQLAWGLAPRLVALRDARQELATRRGLAPFLSRPTLSGMVDSLSAVLPPDARLRLLALDAGGEVEARIDCNDPDALRAALRGDPLLARWRMVGQEPADNGVRIVMRSVP